jgi:hypothetical protein
MVFSAVLFDSKPLSAVAKDGIVPPGRNAACSAAIQSGNLIRQFLVRQLPVDRFLVAPESL